MDSPANCNLDGTTAALREAKMKKIEIKITAKNNWRIGFVKYGLPSIKDGRLKSLVPGGVKPSPSNRRLSTGTPHQLISDCFGGSRETLLKMAQNIKFDGE